MCLTRLDAGVVFQQVSGGTLALHLSVRHGDGGGSVGADAGVPMAGLRQTQQAARVVSTGVVTWGQEIQTSVSALLHLFKGAV